jgi:hypothetical protein
MTAGYVTILEIGQLSKGTLRGMKFWDWEGEVWDLSLEFLFLVKVGVENRTSFWLKIGPGSIWLWVDSLPSNGCLEKRKPLGRLPHENLVFQLSWVGEPIKKIVLRRLVDLNSPDVIMLQETLGVSETVVKALESLFPGWMFAAVDARGRSGGLATGWLKKTCNYESVWGFESGIGLTFFSSGMGRNVTIINVYGPYQDRQRYWNSLVGCSWLSGKEIILGGDLNFSLGAAEVWGPRVVPDSLTNYFQNFLDQHGLIDVEPLKLNPTWCNRRVGDDRVAKHLDRFLLSEDLLESLELVRQWVSCGGESDHNLIVLELSGRSRRASSPFKFFEGWILDPSYQALVRGLWTPISTVNQIPVAVQFVGNLKRLKQATISWAREKKFKEEQELRHIELSLLEIQEGEGKGFLTLGEKENLVRLEKRRRFY